MALKPPKLELRIGFSMKIPLKLDDDCWKIPMTKRKPIVFNCRFSAACPSVAARGAGSSAPPRHRRHIPVQRASPCRRRHHPGVGSAPWSCLSDRGLGLGFHQWWYPFVAGWFIMENPNPKWMMTGGWDYCYENCPSLKYVKSSRAGRLELRMMMWNIFLPSHLRSLQLSCSWAYSASWPFESVPNPTLELELWCAKKMCKDVQTEFCGALHLLQVSQTSQCRILSNVWHAVLKIRPQVSTERIRGKLNQT